jgi:hypothetical protein
MSIIIKYKEWLITAPKDAYWVYDLCNEFPTWDESKQDYVFKKPPKRIDAQTAKQIIKDNSLKCVHNDEDGRVYA